MKDVTEFVLSVTVNRDWWQPLNFTARGVVFRDDEAQKHSSIHSSSHTCHEVIIKIQADHDTLNKDILCG